MLTFRMFWRTGDETGWRPGHPLLVHLDDGARVAPEHLSWGTADGAQTSLGFSPDLATCYGHRSLPTGAVAEVRGELSGEDEPRGGYEFDTEFEETPGRLRLLVDDGSGEPLRWVAWRDGTGGACSLALRSESPSGSADVTDLVTSVWATADHPEMGEVAANLVDGTHSKWFAPYPRAALEFRLPRPVVVERYVLTSGNDAPDRDPAAWTLRGSADGHRWHALDSRTGQSFPGRHQSRTYRIADPAACDHYRLDITGNNGSPHLQLAAVRFLAGTAGFTGHRQRAGHFPVAYRGLRTPPSAAPADSDPPVWTSAAFEALRSAASTPIVRTDFSDPQAWEAAWSDITAPQGYWDGEVVLGATLVARPEFDGWTAGDLAALLSRTDHDLVFVVDAVTLASPEHPVLVIEVGPDHDRPRTFRATPHALVDVETQLSIANMDWEDFSESTDPDGVLRASFAD
ncbi:hypothetical protein GCM10017566_25570 [Amycolatopsis bartoniae]|uniref:Discoidin domain-containing protein n=1 Tax=Amycolatopsis bartoniae TaxID=941986 RepID=A0A8H9MAT0_9PSEU|nr:hypothetical protein GCM10017566_25570 [Amycolatopsis bartoniae]